MNGIIITAIICFTISATLLGLAIIGSKKNK